MARNSDVEGIRRLLAANPALVDAEDGIGDAPLLCAVKFGNEATVSVLLEHGACVEARDAAGKRAIDWVDGIGKLRLLLDAGASIGDQPESFGDFGLQLQDAAAESQSMRPPGIVTVANNRRRVSDVLSFRPCD